jgi:hypothetical protein
MKKPQKTILAVSAAGMLALTLATSAKASLNLIADGDFLTPNLGTAPSSYEYAPSGSSWTFSPLIDGVSGSGITYIPSDFQNSPLNTQVGFLQTAGGTISSTDPASISQGFTASAGSYDLSFSYAGRSYDGGNTTFTVSVDSIVVGTLNPYSGQSLTPQSMNISLVSGNHTLAFTAAGVSGNDETAFIDNVSVSAVPEPTTMVAGALLLLPFGMSTLRILRKSRTA